MGSVIGNSRDQRDIGGTGPGRLIQLQRRLIVCMQVKVSNQHNSVVQRIAPGLFYIVKQIRLYMPHLHIGIPVVVCSVCKIILQLTFKLSECLETAAPALNQIFNLHNPAMEMCLEGENEDSSGSIVDRAILSQRW